MFLDGTFELSITCVDQCPNGTMSIPSETGGMTCAVCEGICPKGIYTGWVVKKIQN